MIDMDMSRTDKNGFWYGPWSEEPDFDAFMHCGLLCIILRHPSMGHLCGYVVMPSEEQASVRPTISEFERNLTAHGGITYTDTFASLCADGRVKNFEKSIDIPEPQRVVLGFDCSHSNDMSPGFAVDGYMNTNVKMYRTFEYVTFQTKSLAEQVWDCILGHVVGD